eukprot:464180_1
MAIAAAYLNGEKHAVSCEGIFVWSGKFDKKRTINLKELMDPNFTATSGMQPLVKLAEELQRQKSNERWENCRTPAGIAPNESEIHTKQVFTKVGARRYSLPPPPARKHHSEKYGRIQDENEDVVSKYVEAAAD